MMINGEKVRTQDKAVVAYMKALTWNSCVEKKHNLLDRHQLRREVKHVPPKSKSHNCYANLPSVMEDMQGILWHLIVNTHIPD